MVGSVEAGAFENDSNRLENLAQGLLTAFGAASQRWFAEALCLVEAHTTIFTPVGIYWHIKPLLYKKNLTRLLYVRNGQDARNQFFESREDGYASYFCGAEGEEVFSGLIRVVTEKNRMPVPIRAININAGIKNVSGA